MVTAKIYVLLLSLLFTVGLTAPIWAASTDTIPQDREVMLKLPSTPPDENPSDKGENPPGGGHGKGGKGGDSGSEEGDGGESDNGDSGSEEGDGSDYHQSRDRDDEPKNPQRFYEFTRVFSEGEFRILNSDDCTQVVWKGIQSFFIPFLAICGWRYSDPGPTLADLGYTWIREANPRYYSWDPATGKMIRSYP